MEIEKIASESYKKQLNEETTSYEGFFHYTDEMIYSAGFKDAVEFCERFIPVTERLPEKDKSGFYVPVLILDEKSKLCCSAAYENNRFIPDSPLLEHEDVTHWRPIFINNSL